LQEFDKNSITKVALSGSTASRRRRRPTCLPRQVPVTARIYRPLTRGVAGRAGPARQAVPGRRVGRARSSVRKGFPVRLSSRLSVHCSPGHGACVVAAPRRTGSSQTLCTLGRRALSRYASIRSSAAAAVYSTSEYFQVPSKSGPKWRFSGKQGIKMLNFSFETPKRHILARKPNRVSCLFCGNVRGSVLTVGERKDPEK